MSLRSSPERGGETKHERAVEIEPSVVIEGMRALDFKSDDLKFMAAAYMARRNNRRIVRGGLSMAQPISKVCPEKSVLVSIHRVVVSPCW